jgi:hypothetical protein
MASTLLSAHDVRERLKAGRLQVRFGRMVALYVRSSTSYHITAVAASREELNAGSRSKHLVLQCTMQCTHCSTILYSCSTKFSTS